tara:strand:- start:1240 stop:3117 length:1878 start_codon:yes stop_codon:yes gene_type:complete
MSYVNKVYRAAVCHIDEFVNGIISKINQFINDILGDILGPLQDILGAIAAPLNIIGQAVNFVLKLLGISCSGPDQTCNKYKKVCTNGEKKKDDKDKDFLDNLLGSIDNLFGDTPGDYTQYVCEEAYTGNPLSATTVGFTGGVPLPGGGGGGTKKPKITYNIEDIKVTRGDTAVFTITRSGDLSTASSVKFKTLTQGTATPDEDFLPIDTIIGFQPQETSKDVNIQTFGDPATERDQEDFYVKITKNSPGEGSGIKTLFIANTARCNIVPVDQKESYNPYKPPTTNPIDDIEVPVDEVTTPDTGDGGDGTDGGDTGDGTDDTTVIQTYAVTANRSVCPEDQFIVYTITTTNVDNGTILYYNLSGNGITSDDIIGGSLVGEFVIQDNQATVTVGIAEDDVVEEQELLTFSIAGRGASVDVLIVDKDDLTIPDFDEGVGDTPETVFEEFKPPVVNIGDVITDDNGGIIEIPVDDPGDPWAEPPYVFVGGNGFGATALALLDGEGFLTEIRVLSPGFGYKKNLSDDNDKRCIIDSFTAVKFGVGYLSKPDIFINNEKGLAEAILDEKGFVIGARMLDRTKTFTGFPDVKVIGGGGYGAQLLPSLVCLDTDALSRVGATKIGTGRYVDCP